MRLLALALVLAFLAGCVAPEATDDSRAPALPPLASADLAFTDVVVIDATRAGGEPVIAITPKGTILVAAHPGWTHTRYPPSTNLLTPASGQSYLWRSTDGGATFAHVGLPMAPDGAGPRGAGQGVSDPDFAIDSEGRVYLTDLEALAAASVSWSDDDGATWLQGNDVASTYGPVDRNWLATHGTDVYFMGNYFAEERVLKSTDRGLTWLQVGAANCAGDLVVRDDGAILVGCGDGIDVSTDGGATFEVRKVPDATSNARVMTEPAIDAAGNVYTAWADENGTWVAGSPDLGATWWPPVQLATGGTDVWPWVVAGSAGRVGVAWYHTDDDAGPAAAEGDWYVDAAIVTGMGTDAPLVATGRVTPTPVFQGAMCQNGTTCQIPGSPTEGDRRLGDFFEAAVDLDGRMNVVFAIALDDTIAHPGFAKVAVGPSLLE